jgi:hypothetical protein
MGSGIVCGEALLVVVETEVKIAGSRRINDDVTQ